jgi:Ice-binding-like
MNASKTLQRPWLKALLLAAVVAGCNDNLASVPIGNVSPTTPGAGGGDTTAASDTGAAAGVVGHGPAPVVLGSAGTYVILAKSGISNVPTSAITGNIGVSPALASSITGLALTLGSGAAFATAPEVTGNIYAPDYAVPTPANLTTAIGDMQTAYVDAAGRSLPDHTELASGNIGGLTLPAGLYKWSNTVLIPTNVTLTGGAKDTWIFQIAGGLTMSNGRSIILAGGAVAKNIFWQVSGNVSIGTTAHFEGRVSSLTSIAVNTGAVVNGRLMAQTAVTLAGNTIVAQ